MRKYYLMRHAHSEDGPRMDPDRTITAKGREQIKAIRKFLKDAGILKKIDCVISSPFKRAYDTAKDLRIEIPVAMNDEEGFKGIILDSELEPDGDPSEAWRSVLESVSDGYVDVDAGFKHVLIVTHDPLIQPMLAQVCFQFSPDHNLFDHANLAHFDADGTFHWFMTPKLAEKLVEASQPEIEAATVALTEHLLRKSRRKVLDPLIKKLERWTIARFAQEFGSDSAIWKMRYRRIARDAFEAGARQAMAQLGPIAVTEARKPIPLPRLPDPERTAAMAETDIDWADGSDSRALAIATYEVSKAYHDGMQAYAGLWRGGNGPVEKRWDVQPDACEVCEANAEMDYVDEESPFDSGDFEPPAHPNCRCSLEYRATPEE